MDIEVNGEVPLVQPEAAISIEPFEGNLNFCSSYIIELYPNEFTKKGTLINKILL